jgi:hypothetical protein
MAPRQLSDQPDEPARTPRSKRRVLLEIAIADVLILAVIWTPRPWQRWMWWIAAAAVVFFTCISFDGTQAMGLRAKNFVRSLWVAGAALIVSGIVCAVAARLNTLRLPHSPIALLEGYSAYAIFAFAQQFLVQCFFLLRFTRLLGESPRAAFAAAGLFALAHLPNPILTLVTLVWGVAACLIFLRYRNLYPLALAHAILGITIAIAVPGRVDHNMRVGRSYLTYGKGSPGFHRDSPSAKP